MSFPRRHVSVAGSLALLLILVLGLTLLLPLCWLLISVLPLDSAQLEALRLQLLSPSIQEAFLRSMAVMLLASGAASLIAIPVAITVYRSGPTIRLLVAVLGIVPLAMPAYLSAAALRHFGLLHDQWAMAQGLAELHPDGNPFFLVAVYAVHYFPLIVFGMTVGLERVDRSFEEAARNLGAGTLFIWRHVLLPLATPGFTIAAAMTALKILEDVATPLVLGIDGMLAPQLLLSYRGEGIHNDSLYALVLVICAISVAITVAAWSSFSPRLPIHVPVQPVTSRLWRKLPRTLIAVPMLLTLSAIVLIPILWLLLIGSGGQWSGELTPSSYQPLPPAAVFDPGLPQHQLTLDYAVATGALLTVLVVCASVVVVHGGAVGRAIRALTTASLAVPGIVIALAYVNAFQLLGEPIARQDAAWTGLSLVVVFKLLPLLQRVVAMPLLNLDAHTLADGRRLGYGGIPTYFTLVLPVLCAVFILGTAAAAAEVSAALVLLQDANAPFAAELYHAIQHKQDTLWAARGLVLTAALAIALTAFLLLTRRLRHPLTQLRNSISR